MQLLAIALAASLVIGPAPVDAVEPTPLPDVDAPADGEVEPEVEPEPEPEVEPEPEPEVEPEPEPEPVPAPSLTDSEQEEALPTAVVSDKLGCDGSKPCRRMTVAGIVIGTLGLAAVGTGIGLLVKRDEVLPAAPTYVTSTRPAGLVALTIGAGVSLTAVLMLVAAHRGYKQRGAQARVAPLINGLRF